MTIELTKLTRLAESVSATTSARASNARVAPKATVEAVSPSDRSAAQQAAAVIQEYLSGPVQPPKFNVDYLSGVNVMTVRSAENGEVVFQMPGPSALRLAQLIKEGVPTASSTLVSETV